MTIQPYEKAGLSSQNVLIAPTNKHTQHCTLWCIYCFVLPSANRIHR